MRLSRFAPGALVVVARVSFAQAPDAAAPAAEPAPAAAEAPPAPAPPPPPEAPAVVVEAPLPAEPAPPTDSASPEPDAPAPEPPAPVGPAPIVASTEPRRADVHEPAPWRRARQALTLEGSLGFVARPQGSDGFDDESRVGTALGLSAYVDLKREIAAGLELERATLGRGTAMSGLDSVSVDYTVTSALLGFRAYPLRTNFVDLFVGLQLGAGIQGVSASGTESRGALLPASPYTCGGVDTPAFQLGGSVGARLMLSERWGLSARVSGAGRRLTGEVVDECARGVGTATTISGSVGLGYDFELDR